MPLASSAGYIYYSKKKGKVNRTALGFPAGEKPENPFGCWASAAFALLKMRNSRQSQPQKMIGISGQMEVEYA